MNSNKRAKRYRTQPARVSIEPGTRPGRSIAHFLFHRLEDDMPAMDFPVSVEIFTKDADRVKKNPELLVINRRGRQVAVKAAGRYTPSWYQLNSLERIRYYIAILKAGY